MPSPEQDPNAEIYQNAVKELREILSGYALKIRIIHGKQSLRVGDQKVDPIIAKKHDQCSKLNAILDTKESAQRKLINYHEQLMIYKKEPTGLTQRRNRGYDRAENILRGFAGILTSSLLVTIPFYVSKLYHGTFFKRTEGRKMLDKSEEISSKLVRSRSR